MPSYDKTALWQQALAAKVDDPYSKERERLRVAYENVRQRAQPIAEEIAKDLPDYTVHDITHSDALWEYADLIAGSRYPINPVEAFILGCAFLLHDLGMGLAVYPDGLSGIKKLELWRDMATNLLHNSGVEEITDDSFLQLSPEIERDATSYSLRRIHAERASRLAFATWKQPKGEGKFYLIEDQELRDGFGELIGKIAASHGSSIEAMSNDFQTVMGAKVGFPNEWTIDALKLACILRCADYAHIDERRAPGFLRVLRRPHGISCDHWDFQAKLYQPRLEGDRLVYTAKNTFKIDESQSWWMCFDTLQAIDSELRRVDSLLADTHRERFLARGVSQVEAAARICKLITTEGWQPVDTKLHVSAVADLVGKLGGEDLYGDKVTPPLRELIQNAADAVRARRIMDHKTSDWGEIRVVSGKDAYGTWIQVEDTGVAMSEAVLTGPFLDFGSSFWGSPLMNEQFPGLASKGFLATGKYGIGFFSVFMWGKRVEVLTQRFEKGRDMAQVLLFSNGLAERPMLRKAGPEEYVPDGGTRVKVWLSSENTYERLISTYDDEIKLSLAQVCAGVAPCLDVTVKSLGDKNELVTAINANDWQTIADEALLHRINYREHPAHKVKDKEITIPKLQLLRKPDGQPLGRAAIMAPIPHVFNSMGIVVVGGFRASRLYGIIGVLLGSSKRATRDCAFPIIPVPELTKWVDSERDLRIAEKHSPETQIEIASIITSLGRNADGLFIAQTDSGGVTLSDIYKTVKSLQEVLLIDEHKVRYAGGKVAKVELYKGVIVNDAAITPVIQSGEYSTRWPEYKEDPDFKDCWYYSRSPRGAILRIIAAAWECPVKDLISEISSVKNKKLIQREIGVLLDKPFIEEVEVVTRPKKK